MPDLLPTARGFVNTWQCDENDHLNVQFFTAFADDASVHLHTALGLGPTALERAGLKVRPVEDHIRYHRELRGEDAVDVFSAPVTVEDGRLVAYHEIRNGYDGSLAATIRRVTACRGADGSAASWPAAFRDAAQAAAIALPEAAKPRTAGLSGPLPVLTLAGARQAGLREINRSVVQPAECSADGTLLPRFHFARYSDGAGHLWQALGFDRAQMRENHQGTVVVEMRQEYRDPPAMGRPTVVLSGLLNAAGKSLHFGHFMFDAESGAMLGGTEAVAVMFDQKARRAMAIPEAQKAQLRPLGTSLGLKLTA